MALDRRSLFRHGLAFYGTLSFVAAFFGARAFATLNPTVVVVRSGIHFHHFWYGLAMVVGSGWTGIALSDAKIGRVLAIVFGLGAGLIGDEVGLLLTFGDYYSSLTEVFFVGAIGFIILAMLLSRGRNRIEKDVFDVSPKERLMQIGVFIVGFSTIFFAANNWTGGLATFVAGLLVFFWGLERRRKESKLNSLASRSAF